MIFSNNIPPTDIIIFSRFSNLKVLKIGTTKGALAEGRHNKFFGSLQAYQNLTQLRNICIEAIDVDRGLEYLPASLVQAIWGEGLKYFKIECSPHLEYLPPNTPQPKCKAIQDQLRPFDYDLSAWQLANFNLMLKTNPLSLWKLYLNLFTEKDQKEKLFSNLIIKIEEVQQEIGLVKASENQKTEKLARLENKLTLLQKKVTELEAELQMEREEAEKALEKAKEWRERQLKEMTDRKDKEISELKNNVEAEKRTQNKLTSQLREKEESVKWQDGEITDLNEKFIQLKNELATTQTQLTTTTSDLTKTEENLGWIKVIMVRGILALIGLQVLFGIWIFWGNRRNKKKCLVK